MGMDSRLRLGSQPLRNQCRGTGEPQVCAAEKNLWEEQGECMGGVKLPSFISIITIKNHHSGWYRFLICNRKHERERLMLQTPSWISASPPSSRRSAASRLITKTQTHDISRIDKFIHALFMFMCIKSKIKGFKCKFSN